MTRDLADPGGAAVKTLRHLHARIGALDRRLTAALANQERELAWYRSQLDQLRAALAQLEAVAPLKVEREFHLDQTS